MLRAVRRHRVLSALAGGVVILVLVVAGAWWYLFGNERRAGQHVAALITGQTGIEVTVGRFQTDGADRWRLYSVHVPPGTHWSGDIRIRELTIDGGVLPILSPRGRSLTVVAVATSVTLGTERAPFRGPTAEAVEALRQLVLQAVDWPATFSLHVEGGELRAGDQTFTFDLKGEKSQTGALGFTLSVSPPGGPPALTVMLAGARAGDRVALRIGLQGEPSRLGAFWPAALPAFKRLAGQLDGNLGVGGDVDIVGRLRGESGGHDAPAVLELTSRYRAARERLEVTRFALGWGPDLSLTGTASAELKNNISKATVDLGGTVDRSRVAAQLNYTGGTGAVAGKLDVNGIEAERLLTRIGLKLPPLDLHIQSWRSTFTGAVGDRDVRLAVQAALGDLQARGPLPGVLFDGALQIDATLHRGATGYALASLAPSTLAFDEGGHRVIVLAARSPAGAPWPLQISVNVDDLRRLPALPSLPSTLTGKAVIAGALDHTRFTGSLKADLARAEITVGRPVVATRMRIDVPVTYGTPPPDKPGDVTIDRLEAFGFALDRLRGDGRFADGLFRLSDISYVHYGGQGTGWIEAAIDRRPVPLRSRIEGEHIDLAVLTREYPITVARLSGRVRYLIILQHSLARGINGAGQVNSEEEGGEISIDAIKKLINSGHMPSDSLGLARQVLENLRVFRYASLDGDVRVSKNGGYINLTIEGKKRLGIFPPPVKEISFANVPISLLASTFARKETP